MSDVADQVLGFLQAKSPEEVRRILDSLARQARVDALEKQENDAERVKALQDSDLDSLSSRLSSMRPDDPHFKELKQAHAAKLEASKPAPFVLPDDIREGLELKPEALTRELESLQKHPSQNHQRMREVSQELGQLL